MGTTRKIAIDELRTDGCQLRTRIDLEHVDKTYSREPVAGPKVEQDVDAWLDSDPGLPAKPIVTPVAESRDFSETPTDRIAWGTERFSWLWDQYQAKFGEDAAWIYFSAAWEQFKESAGYE